MSEFLWKGSVCDFCEQPIKDIPPKYFDEDHTIVCGPCLTLEVIKTLVKELDKHGDKYVNGSLIARNNAVISALAVGQYWLDSHAKESETKRCDYCKEPIDGMPGYIDEERSSICPACLLLAQYVAREWKRVVDEVVRLFRTLGLDNAQVAQTLKNQYG